MPDLTEGSFEDFLNHYGVRGMRWGRRKAARADAKWERKSQKTYLAIYDKMAVKLNGEIDAFNNQPKYRNKDLTKNPTLQKQYFKEYSTRATKVLNDIAATDGVNPSGTRRLEFKYDVERDGLPQWKIVDNT